MSSPRYSDRVRYFAFVNVAAFIALMVVFPIGAVVCAILGAGVVGWYRFGPSHEMHAGRSRPEHHSVPVH